MKINEVIGEWMIMPQSIKPMGLIRKPGGGFDFKNKGNNKANEFDNPREKPQVRPRTTMTSKEIGDRVEKAKEKLTKKPASFDFSKLFAKDKPASEDAAGVGIITKQNTTVDVKPGDEYKNVKKLGLSK